MLRNKGFAGLVALCICGATTGSAQEADTIECIAKQGMVTFLSLDCPYDIPEDPQCYIDHVRTFSSDPDTYRATEARVQDWIENYAQERGFELSSYTSRMCPVAHQEFADQTVIGQMLTAR